jgi:hypothetical protein
MKNDNCTPQKGQKRLQVASTSADSAATGGPPCMCLILRKDPRSKCQMSSALQLKRLEQERRRSFPFPIMQYAISGIQKSFLAHKKKMFFVHTGK